jgi:hypothetical protein
LPLVRTTVNLKKRPQKRRIVIRPTSYAGNKWQCRNL